MLLKSSQLEWLEGPVSTVLSFLPFPSPSSLPKHKVILKRGDRQRTERIWPPVPWQWSKQNLKPLPKAPVFITAHFEDKCTLNM